MSHEILKPIARGLDLRDRLLADGLRGIGGAADEYSVIFDDFERLAYKSGTGNQPTWGEFTDVNWTAGVTAPSVINPNGTSYIRHLYNPTAFGAICANRWMAACRVVGNTGTMNCITLASIDEGGWPTLIGSVGVYSRESTGLVRGGYGSANIVGGGDASSYVELGSTSSDFQTWMMRSKGDGTVEFRLNDGAWSTPVEYSPADTGAGVEFRIGSTSGYMQIDWVFFALKVR